MLEVSVDVMPKPENTDNMKGKTIAVFSSLRKKLSSLDPAHRNNLGSISLNGRHKYLTVQDTNSTGCGRPSEMHTGIRGEWEVWSHLVLALLPVLVKIAFVLSGISLQKIFNFHYVSYKKNCSCLWKSLILRGARS